MRFKDGDIIVRTWPSGHETLGEVVDVARTTIGMFKSLETYNHEGGVTKGDKYGYATDYAGIPYRLATKEDIRKMKIRQVTKKLTS